MRLSYSQAALQDFFDIGFYTLERWGSEQTDVYLAEQEDCCEMLANQPMLGKAVSELSADLRRFEQGRHSIFYMPQSGGILVMRVLHQRMIPSPERLMRGD